MKALRRCHKQVNDHHFCYYADDEPASSFQVNKRISDSLFGPVDHDPELLRWQRPTYSGFDINNFIINVLIQKFWVMIQVSIEHDLPRDILMYTFLHLVCVNFIIITYLH